MTERKRSRALTFLMLGGTVFAVAGCEDDRVDAALFSDEQSCIAAGRQSDDPFWAEEDCRVAFAVAEEEHAETAPRYESQALCEEQHGQGSCGADEAAPQAATGGGGSVFMPLLAGYMIGSMMGGNRAAVASKPVYAQSGGGYATATGQRFNALNAVGKANGTAFTTRAASTAGKPPMTRANVAARGGFGGTGGGSVGG